jgi:hypothetical protein
VGVVAGKTHVVLRDKEGDEADAEADVRRAWRGACEPARGSGSRPDSGSGTRVAPRSQSGSGVWSRSGNGG